MAPKVYSFEAMRQEFLEAVKNSVDSKNVDLIQKKFNYLSMVSELEKRSALDQVLRDHLLSLLTGPLQPVSTWEMYLNLCIEACRKEMVTTTMPVVLLSEIFDGSTLDKCEELFKFVENNVFIWKEEMFFAACKNNLLRMCNDLLRRLSRSQNTVFCGRILLFLAKFFPFSERSGLNIVSEFNLENITEFSGDETLDFSQMDDKEDVVDEGKTDKLKIDYNLYTKFWALQDFFRNPNQCYNKVQWKVFCSHTANVLSAFKSFKLEDVQSKRTSSLNHKQDDSQHHYFAKFLTNQKLLELQLGDINFRRYVLVQFLILFQYLNSHVKFKPDSFELKAEQLDLIKDTTQQVYTLLKETPPDGASFTASVQHILQREEHWNNWKNDGCPEFQKPATPAEDVMEEEKKQRPSKPRKRLGDMFREGEEKKVFILGKPELNRLWNRMPDNLESCKSPDRDFLPSLESYFEEAIDQADPEAMVEDQYKRLNDGSFGWRALRLLARKSPHFFTHSNSNINKLPEYLESMVKKIPKERPGPMTQSSDTKMDVVVDIGVVVEPGLVNEGEDEDELLKTEELRREELGNSDDADIGSTRSFGLTKQQLDSISLLVADKWKPLAGKLGFQADEIDFFAVEKKTDAERARLMLQVWSEECDEASSSDFPNILSELGFKEAVEVLKM